MCTVFSAMGFYGFMNDHINCSVFCGDVSSKNCLSNKTEVEMRYGVKNETVITERLQYILKTKRTDANPAWR